MKRNSSAVYFMIYRCFLGRPLGASFVCLPARMYTFYLLTYRARPMQANKNRRLFSFERVMLYQNIEKGNDVNGKREPEIIMLYQNSPK